MHLGVECHHISFKSTFFAPSFIQSFTLFCNIWCVCCTCGNWTCTQSERFKSPSLTQLIIVESWTFSPTKNRQRSALLAKTHTLFTAMLMPIISHLFKGLIGCLIVCKKGTLEENKPWKRKDVDHEFCLRFALTNEGFSWYLNENKNLAGNASTIDASKWIVLK